MLSRTFAALLLPRAARTSWANPDVSPRVLSKSLSTNLTRCRSFSWPCTLTDGHTYPVEWGLTVFLLGDEVVLGLDAGLEGVQILPFVLLDVGCHPLQDVVGRWRAAASAALGAAGLRDHVGILIHHLVFLEHSGKFMPLSEFIKEKVQLGKCTLMKKGSKIESKSSVGSE